jgi:hypothetical protein
MHRLWYFASIAALLGPFTPPALPGQIDVGGQISPAFVSTSNRTPQLSVNDGRPTFLWRLDLFADAYISDRVSAFINFRSHQDQLVNIDYLAVRISNISPLRFNIQAGKFDIPFGNLYGRRFPRNNFLFDLPLIYEYRTVLMSDYLYATRQAMLQNRGLGGSRYTPSSLPLLDRGMYGIGGMLFGSAGIFDYYVGLMNGTVSNTGGYSNGMNDNAGLGKFVRIAATPAFGFTIGGAFGWGRYLSENISPPGETVFSAGDYRQYTGSLDIEYSRGHVQVFTQAVYAVWEHPIVPGDLAAFGYYAESKYTFRPRWFVAGRVNQLIFSDISHDGENVGWDHDVLQFEGGIGYAIDRNTLVKAVVKETLVYGSTRIRNTQAAIQLVTGF